MLIERRWRYSPRCNVCTFCVVCHACKKSWTQNIEMSTVFLMTLMSMTATTKKEEAVPSDFFVRLVRWFKTIRATGSFCVLHETQVNSSRPHPPRKIINLRDYNYVLQVPGNQIAKIFFCCYSVTFLVHCISSHYSLWSMKWHLKKRMRIVNMDISLLRAWKNALYVFD